MSTWIWYFGDFEVRQHLLLSSRREEKGKNYPCMWSVSDCNKNVFFHRDTEIDEPETVAVYAEGLARINIDNKTYYTKCKHYIQKYENIDVSLVNLTEAEFKEKNRQWDIDKFSHNNCFFMGGRHICPITKNFGRKSE